MGETKGLKHKEKIKQLGIPARLYSHIPQPGQVEDPSGRKSK
jgi:hypothetical protein